MSEVTLWVGDVNYRLGPPEAVEGFFSEILGGSGASTRYPRLEELRDGRLSDIHAALAMFELDEAQREIAAEDRSRFRTPAGEDLFRVLTEAFNLANDKHVDVLLRGLR